MTHSYESVRDARDTNESYMTQSYVTWHDSFICLAWPILMWHDSFIWISSWCKRYEWVIHDSIIRNVTWLIQWSCMTHSYVTWLIHMQRDMTQSYVIIPIRLRTQSCGTRRIHVTWHIHACDGTHSCVWRDTYIYATWLTYTWHDSFTCDMTHSHVTWIIHVWHDSHVTWLVHLPRQVFDGPLRHLCMCMCVGVCVCVCRCVWMCVCVCLYVRMCQYIL